MVEQASSPRRLHLDRCRAIFKYVLLGAEYMGMSGVLLGANGCYLRHRALGTDAVYEVLSEDAGIVTAEVLSAPGLVAGTRVRLLARAAAAMEQVDVTSLPQLIGSPFPRSGRALAGQLASR